MHTAAVAHELPVITNAADRNRSRRLYLRNSAVAIDRLLRPREVEAAVDPVDDRSRPPGKRSERSLKNPSGTRRRSPTSGLQIDRIEQPSFYEVADDEVAAIRKVAVPASTVIAFESSAGGLDGSSAS